MKDVHETHGLENIEVKNLWLKRGNYQIFKDFSYSFPAGKVTALMASSGAGKTSLLDCIAGLLQPNQGSISGGGSVSYLFQEPRLLPWYSQSSFGLCLCVSVLPADPVDTPLPASLNPS